MIPEDLPRTRVLSALAGARVVYFDVRMPESALVIAHEVRYMCNCIFIALVTCKASIDNSYYISAKSSFCGYY